jgi:hypothetical protein
MKTKPRGLSIYQKLRIKELASPTKTIPQLAKEVGTYYSLAYAHVVRNNLPCKVEGDTRANYYANSAIPNGKKFNVNEKENWLI